MRRVEPGVVVGLYQPLVAQEAEDSMAETILQQDGVFWDAYNRCDLGKMSEFFWPDIKFYHDKGGPTIGLGPLTETFPKNLYGNPNFRLRREFVPVTVKFYTLQKNGVTYGASALR